MLDMQKIGGFIAEKRRQHSLTQQQLAGRLNISFQAVSKWENGTASPNIELLAELAAVLGVTADELLAGRERAKEGLSYSRAGVDIAYTDAMKREMATVTGAERPPGAERPGRLSPPFMTLTFLT